MKIYILRHAIVLLFFSCVTTWAQLPDSLLYISPFENEQIQKQKNKTADPTALFMAFDSDTIAYEEARSQLQSFYRYIELQGFQNRSEKAFAKNLFTAVHDQFFRKYEDISPFSKIFQNGHYNCVSATALFAIILTHYKIPYQVKEAPSHVYLVAYPGSHNILYEATNPGGYYAPDSKTKESYVNNLIKMKLVTSEYVSAVGYPRAFEEMYYSKDNVDLSQLASFQYSNQALELYREKNVEAAIPYILKACSLNPSTKNEYLKISLLGEQLNNSKFEGNWDIIYLIELGNSLRDESVKRDVAQSFQAYIYQKLFKNSNDSVFLASYQLLKANIMDSTLRDEITQLYNIGLSQWYGVKGNPEESMKYARVAYRHSPNDATIHEQITTLIIKQTALTLGNTNSLRRLNDYVEEFLFLKENEYFMSMFGTNYAYLSYKNFTADQREEGYRYMKLLEEEFEKRGKGLLIVEDLIALAYAEAGAYHYRKKEYRTAKEIIMKGFKYVPDDEELKARLEIVEKELK